MKEKKAFDLMNTGKGKEKENEKGKGKEKLKARKPAHKRSGENLDMRKHNPVIPVTFLPTAD